LCANDLMLQFSTPKKTQPGQQATLKEEVCCAARKAQAANVAS
jgi:hypothetical protein